MRDNTELDSELCSLMQAEQLQSTEPSSQSIEPKKKRRYYGMSGAIMHIAMMSGSATATYEEHLTYNPQKVKKAFDYKAADYEAPDAVGSDGKQKKPPKHHNSQMVDPAKEKRKKKAQRQARKKNRK